MRSVPPPRHASRVRAAAEGGGGHYGVAARQSIADWSSLTFIDGTPIDFAVPLMTRMPEVGYGIFAGGRVLTRSGYPVTADGVLLIDAVNVHEQSKFRTFGKTMHLRAPVDLAGEVVNLATIFSSGNYGHALLDGLGRLGLLRQAGYDLQRAQTVIMPALGSKSLARLVEMAGVRPEALVVPERGAHYVCEFLVQPTFPGRPRTYSNAPAEFFRSVSVPRTGAGRRLLMLRQGDKRAVANAEELLGLADEYSLEVYEARESTFSPSDFAAADLVVGAHGAGLSDIAFCAEGTPIVELMPSHHRYPYFATLAVSSSLRYRAVRGSSVTEEIHADFTVDVDSVRRAIDEALARA